MFRFPNEESFADDRFSGRRGQREDWKNDAFINIYLPGADGEPRRLGSIGLKMSRHAERGLIEYLQKNPEAVTQLFQGAEFSFRMADGSSSAGFALPQAQ